jgi:hypothetical protein
MFAKAGISLIVQAPGGSFVGKVTLTANCKPLSVIPSFEHSEKRGRMTANRNNFE